MISRPEEALSPPGAFGNRMATEDIEGWVFETTECSPTMMQRASVTNVPRSLSNPLNLSSLELSVKHPANYMLMDHSTCLIGNSLESDKETNSPTSPVKMSKSHSPAESSDMGKWASIHCLSADFSRCLSAAGKRVANDAKKWKKGKISVQSSSLPAYLQST